MKVYIMMMNNFNILVVDDVIENIQMAIDILHNDNYHFHYALNGKKAIEIIMQNPKKYDLILLDVMMPEMDGHEACEIILNMAECEDLPIIFLTAKTDIGTITKCLSSGAVDYISKPYHAEELKLRVKNHLAHAFAKNLLRISNAELEKKLTQTKANFDELEENHKELLTLQAKLIEKAQDQNPMPEALLQLVADLEKHHPNLGQNL